MADLIDTKESAELAEVNAAGQCIAALRSELAQCEVKMGKLGKQEGELSRKANAAADDIRNEAVQAALEDREPRKPDPALVQAVRKGGQFKDTAAAARDHLAREREVIRAQIADAEDVFAGAVFKLTGELNARAQAAVIECLTAAAGPLRDLLAIDAIHARFCGNRRLKVKLDSNATAPFSGEHVVKAFTDKLPVQFRTPAIELLELHKQAGAVVQELSDKISQGDMIG
jgi:hypothetical protein